MAAATALLTALALLAAPAAARAGGVVAFDLPQFQAAASLQVTIPDVADDGPLPIRYTASGHNTSPPLSWTSGPAKTKSFVVLLQDPDAPGEQPAVHWLVWAIAPTVTSLPRDMRNVSEPTNPLGAAQGANVHGSIGYTGPRPPAGEPAHHYHFQVFALDHLIRTHPGSDPGPVLRAMSGHVIAKGQLVATFAAPAPKPAATGAAPPRP